MKKQRIELELPQPVYEFLCKATKNPQRFLQQIFECSLRSFFNYYWGERYSNISSLLREYVNEPEIKAGFEPISDSEIMQKILKVLN